MPGQKLTECAPVPLNRTASFPADFGRRHAPERSCGQSLGGGIFLACGSPLHGTAHAELPLVPCSEERSPKKRPPLPSPSIPTSQATREGPRAAERRVEKKVRVPA